MARQIGDISLIHSQLSNSRVHFTEGFEAYRHIYGNSGNIATSLAKIIPTMASNVEAKQLVMAATYGKKKVILQMKKQLGFLLKPILGGINGWYCLNLSHDVDRMTMNRFLLLLLLLLFLLLLLLSLLLGCFKRVMFLIKLKLNGLVLWLVIMSLVTLVNQVTIVVIAIIIILILILIIIIIITIR